MELHSLIKRSQCGEQARYASVAEDGAQEEVLGWKAKNIILQERAEMDTHGQRQSHMYRTTKK